MSCYVRSKQWLLTSHSKQGSDSLRTYLSTGKGGFRSEVAGHQSSAGAVVWACQKATSSFGQPNV